MLVILRAGLTRFLCAVNLVDIVLYLSHLQLIQMNVFGLINFLKGEKTFLVSLLFGEPL